MSSLTPDFAAWVAQVETGLRGKSWRDLHWTTLDGISVPPVSRPVETESLPHRAVDSLLRARRGFAIRELIAIADPRAAAARAKAALDGGADEVELCLDTLAHDAISPGGSVDDDPDADPFATPPPGEGGVAVHTHRDFELAVEGLDLARTSLSFSAGEGALAVYAWWVRRARAQQIPLDHLRGGLDMDPIEQILSRRSMLRDDNRSISRRADPDRVFDTAAGVVGFARAHTPGIRPLVLDAQSYHLTGASPALEIGLLLAAVAEVGRGLAERGVGFEQLSAAATLRVQVGHEFVTEIAKLRALRLTFAKLACAFGAGGAALVPRILALTSWRFRADLYDHRTNLIRSALASTAAVIGGCDGLIVMPFGGSAEQRGRELALDQQNLLRHEAHLERVTDPAGGSAAIEQMTDGIARAAWAHLQTVERAGGLIAAARAGSLTELIAEREAVRERAFRTRARGLVGISRYADLELGGPDEQELDLAEMDEFADAALDRFEKFVRRRDEKAATAYVKAIRRAASPALLDAVLADGADAVTLEELVTATWPRVGSDFEHAFQPMASADGAAFEELRAQLDALRESGDPVPEVILLRVGTGETIAARADFARDLLNAVGVNPRVTECADLGAAVLDVANIDSGAVVICADDSGNAELVHGIRTAVGDGVTIVWVGKPGPDASLSIDLAIHRGLDVAAAMTEFHRRLGILYDGSE